ncbi:gamma-glutamyl-gamma-aminobutyrate hydrolase family protein [Bifidobacterium choloepi]|uniref:Gamma-glutamyl-gamma-aminobutyrate hydrolase family protein n=1 Tax=Bifidobacterium choloepi TaxID=2614131 RepID=A0A6I5N3H0_9BIFI|nr:gamma-glutamyl-gamma-aminobutyrate hydrolase family protein [Bifidobacterium choloepi]NEG70219.1 gamma-glutamyl-gamma-aminobutyrate hydrolase family protein [Bifidobacterium choloepi]
MKPVIGVMPLIDEARDSYWMLTGYFTMLEAEGAIPLMPPPTDDRDTLDYLLDTCDGFLFTGGPDVDPGMYGAGRTPACHAGSPVRDAMEGYLLPRLADLDKPVLGICRGLQVMNAALGGTLYQDLPTEQPDGLGRRHRMSAPYDREVHGVAVVAGSRLDTLLRRSGVTAREDSAGRAAIASSGESAPLVIGVNSYHHQGVRDVAPALAVAAVAEDGLVEALEMPGGRFFLGIQWHPEFCYAGGDRPSRAIVAAFVDSCRQ